MNLKCILGSHAWSGCKCSKCGNKYNGKTGGDNTVGIVIYSLIVGFAAFALMFAAFFFIAKI